MKFETAANEDSVTKASSKKLMKRRGFYHAKTVIAFCSLKEGTGCTYIAKALKKHIECYTGWNVCIVTLEQQQQENDLINIENIEFAYDNYDFILLDLGKDYLEHESEVSRASIRIMCAIYQQDYIYKLAKLLQSKNHREWKFIYNFVAPKSRHRVEELMEDYDTISLPSIDIGHLDKKTSKHFTNLLTKGKF